MAIDDNKVFTLGTSCYFPVEAKDVTAARNEFRQYLIVLGLPGGVVHCARAQDGEKTTVTAKINSKSLTELVARLDTYKLPPPIQEALKQAQQLCMNSKDSLLLKYNSIRSIDNTAALLSHIYRGV